MVLLELFRNLRITNVIIKHNYCTAAASTASTQTLGVQLKKWTVKPREPPREIWIENMDSAEEKKVGLLQLHPEIFGMMPRIDVIHRNVTWQKMYRHVSYSSVQVWHEMKGARRKPWPQKGQGRARHGTRHSVLFKGGELAHGPRPYKTYFFMLPYYLRIMGLTSTLSTKLAQDDLHVVDSLDIPSMEPSYINEMIEKRNWGPSVLFVDDTDIMPPNISMATDTINHVNLMPVYGLNVYSMLKHDTLVLTTAAVERIETRLLEKLHTAQHHKYQKKFRSNQQ